MKESYRSWGSRLMVVALPALLLAACGSGTSTDSQTASADAGARCTSGLETAVLGAQGGVSTQVQLDVAVPDCWPEGRNFTLGANWEVVGSDTSEVLCSAKFSFDEAPRPGSSHRLNLKFSDCSVRPGREISVRTDAPDFALASTKVIAGGDAAPTAQAQPTAPRATAAPTAPPRTAAPASSGFDLVEVRTGEHDDYSRLVFEFGGGPRPNVNVGVYGSELTVQFGGDAIGGRMNQVIKDTSRIGTPVVGEGGTQWKIPVPAGVTERDQWMDGPTRLVVDLSGPTFASAEQPPVSRAETGYQLVEIRTGDEGSRNRVVFEFDGAVPPRDVSTASGGVVVSFDGDVRGPDSTDYKSSVVGSVNRAGPNSWLIEGVSSVDDSSELTGPSRVVIDF